MSKPMDQEPQVGREMQQMPDEPLLPIEKKLIGWSLAIGLVLLIILVAISRIYFPAG